MTIKIIGAGMAGLLAARMLHHHNPVVYESQPELPNNHSAVLRFRTPAVGDLIGVSFKKVQMTKASVPWRNPVADAMAYSRKTSGVSRSDRSLPLTPERHDRWVAPVDFVASLSAGVAIEFDKKFTFNDFVDEKVLSTIPMPALMSALEYQGRHRINFKSVSGFNVRAHLHDVEAYVSLYVPDPELAFNRVSITGSELIVEYACPLSTLAAVRARMARMAEKGVMLAEVERVLRLLGLEDCSNRLATFPTATLQPYAKILPIDDSARRQFIFWASTIERRAYQLGRFATWRPGLLVDDLVKDIRLIDGWIKTGDYGVHIHEAEKRSPA